MLSIEQIRELEPTLRDAPDEDIESIRESIYAHAQLALECFLEEKTGEKHEVPTPSVSDFMYEAKERAALKRCKEIMDLKKKA